MHLSVTYTPRTLCGMSDFAMQRVFGADLVAGWSNYPSLAAQFEALLGHVTCGNCLATYSAERLIVADAEP
jgi:hypothetical protein